MTNTAAPSSGSGRIKCLVWDLDHTIWDGILLEDSSVSLRPGLRDVLLALDERGILLSIASKNDAVVARAKLEELDISEYFLYPQFSWSPKSESIRRIAESLNIGLDALAFIDDQAFERDEVRFSHPSVTCYDAAALSSLLEFPDLRPRFHTEDARNRRALYRANIARQADEEKFAGPANEFLATLGMVIGIHRACADDLSRVEELTVRTHQLNTTGYAYSYEELDHLRSSPNYRLLVVDLDDRYGSYGKVGVCLLGCTSETWTVKLLLMSCRVATRGIGTILVTLLRTEARSAGVKLRAEFVANDRNRMMYVTYRFNGFRPLNEGGAVALLEDDGSDIPPFPSHVVVNAERGILQWRV
jgi:FkbH-like protein